MTEIAVRPTSEVEYATDPTGGRLVAWAKAATAAHNLASALVQTTFVPQHFKGNTGDATAAIIAGDELGLSPLASLRSFYVVHGTPALYARAMVALVLSAGHEVWTEKSTDAEVIVCGQRKGSNHVERSSWTTGRASKAGYTSNKKYQTQPQEMLYSKAAAEISKKVGPDVLAGIAYSVEDLELDQVGETNTAAPAATTRMSRKKPEPAPVAEPSFDDEPQDAEVIPDVTDSVALITTPQMRKMQALFGEKGFADSDDRRAYIQDVMGITVASTKDLTTEQASAVIESLTALEPPAAAS